MWGRGRGSEWAAAEAARGGRWEEEGEEEMGARRRGEGDSMASIVEL